MRASEAVMETFERRESFVLRCAPVPWGNDPIGERYVRSFGRRRRNELDLTDTIDAALRPADLDKKRSPAVEFPVLPTFLVVGVSPHGLGVYERVARVRRDAGFVREREGGDARNHGNPKRLLRMWAVVRFRR
jgi:hypothetical protein